MQKENRFFDSVFSANDREQYPELLSLGQFLTIEQLTSNYNENYEDIY